MADVKLVPIGELKPSKWNRTDLGNGDLKELATNIGVEGILIPLIVRSFSDKEELEIVAGHRRFAAAKIAGLKMVPCFIRQMDDQEAMRVQVIENLHRKNLNAMEEARAFEQLRQGSHTAQSIADMVNKPVKYIYRALELLKLPKKAQDAIEKGALTAAHGHQLARVGPKQIETTLVYALTKDYNDTMPTVEDLKRYIGQRVEKQLSSAPWDKSVAFAGAIACKGCPYNSGNQDVLFDDAEEGTCSNGACFSTKTRQFYKDLQAAGEKKWPTLKFIGTATAAYGDRQIIQGYEQVEPADPKVKQALKETKDGFVVNMGFGIVKPSNWGKVKRPALVMLKKLSAEKAKQESGYREPTPEERCHDLFLDRFIKRELAVILFQQAAITPALWRTIVGSVIKDRWTLSRSERWLNAAGIDPTKKLKEIQTKVMGLSDDKAIALGFWIMGDVSCSEAINLAAEHSEVDLEKETARARAVAEKLWEVNKAKLLEQFKKERSA